MKRVVHLMGIIVCITLLNMGCEKDKNTASDLTVNDLTGNWVFDSLEFNGEIYKPGIKINQLDAAYDYVMFSVLDVTATTLGIYDHLGSVGSINREYTLSDNTIDFDDGGFVFYIENWETFEGTVLKLRMMSSALSANAPVGGVYTFTKAL